MSLRTTHLPKYLVMTGALLLVAQLVAVSAQAQNQVTTCGTVITRPGTYNLANDLLGCAEDGIVIRSGGVTLNLNGHQITGFGRSGTRGIQVTSPTKELVIIDGPGTIADFENGVDMDLAHGSAYIVSVTAQKNRIGFYIVNGKDVTLGNSKAINNALVGFALYDTDDSRLVESTANANGSGINVLGFRNEIVLNTANDNNTYGILVFGGAHNRISSNTALRNSRYDLFQGGENCENNTWVNNMFKTANLPCIH
jgi:parallel beta-helix repeat protein